MKKSIIKSILFVTCACALFAALSSLLRPVRNTKSFYEQTEDMVDVLLLGSSHTHCNINPNILWDEAGLAAQGFTTPMQPMSVTYYYLQEALKTQSPKLVVLDVFTLYPLETEDGYLDSDSPHLKRAANGLKLSPTKLEMVKNNVRQQEDAAQFILDLALYHNRWSIFTKNLDIDEFRYKGYLLSLGTSDKVTPITAEEHLTDYPKTTETARILPRNLDYLNKIVALTKEKGIDLLLVKTPNPATLKSTEQQAIYNSLHQYAETEQIPFIDFNGAFEKIGLDFSKDFLDEGHLNIFGAEKFSRYLAAYLTAHYSLEDRRPNPDYADWDAEVRAYLEFQHLLELKQVTDIREYAQRLADIDRYVIASSARNQFHMPEGFLTDSRSPLGIQNGVGNDTSYSYFSVYNKTDTDDARGYHYEEASDTSVLDYKNVRDGLPIILEIQSNHFEENSRASIKIDGTEYSINRTGLNFVVYDPVNQLVVDRFNVSPGSDEPYAITR